MSIVQNWLLSNILTLNVNKSDKYMIIGSRQKFSQLINEPVLTIGSESISRVSSNKTLGVVVDQWMNESPGAGTRLTNWQRKPQKELAC